MSQIWTAVKKENKNKVLEYIRKKKGKNAQKYLTKESEAIIIRNLV